MRYRTNYDVIDNNTGKIFIRSRGYDCFGQYTNDKENLILGNNHTVKYYLPRNFISFEDGKMILKNYNSTTDKLIFNDEEIEFYLNQLNNSIPSSNIKRIDDFKYNIHEFDSSTVHYSYIDLEPAVTLQIDLSNSINCKDIKIQLFLCRYLINFYGNKVLSSALNLINKDKSISFWDAFLMSELCESFIKGTRNYAVFAGKGIFKHFTFEHFYNNVIVAQPNDFFYEETYKKQNYTPYYHLGSSNDLDYYDKATKQTKTIDIFRNFYAENGLGKEFLEFWKNYNW